jgi:hypothetical protein
MGHTAEDEFTVGYYSHVFASQLGIYWRAMVDWYPQ